MPDDKRDRPTWLRYSGVGMEFAASLVVFCLVGYWVDLRYGTSPWGLVIGLGLGLTGATYNLFRATQGAFGPRYSGKPRPPKDRTKREDERRS